MTSNKNKNNKRRDIVDIIAKYEHLQDNKIKRKKAPIQIEKGIAVNHNCDYCKTPLAGKMYMFKVAAFERFFCCNECKMAYKKKYAGRMKAISKRFS